MTVSTTLNRISYTANGATTVFSFPYKFLISTDLKVYVATVLQTSGYTVGTPSDTGANVTFSVAPANLASIVIVSDPDNLQSSALPSTGPFPAKTVETMSDKLTLLVQRLQDLATRSFTLSDSDVSGVSVTIPTPVANKVLGWNATGTAIANVDAATVATNTLAALWNNQKFSGTGAQTAFTLSSNGGTSSNVAVVISGVRQFPDVDYTVSGTTLTFTTAPVVGTNNILAVWATAYVQSGVFDSASVTHLPAGTGAVATTVQAQLRNTPYYDSTATNLIGPAGKQTYIHNIKNKFFASLPSGANYRSQKALFAPPAWVSGTLVQAGYVCQNGGNTYVLLGTLSTNSQISVSAGVATTTAPTGTGTGVITGADTLQWLHMGAVDTAVANTEDVPAFSVATVPASCTRRYDPQVAADLASFFVTGENYVNQTSPGGGVNGIGVSGSNRSFLIDFVTDAPIVAINKIQNGGGLFFSPQVNGVMAYPKSSIAGFTWIASGSSNNFSHVLDWSAKPNKTRRIRIPQLGQGLSSTFTGVWIAPQYSVWKYANPNRYRLYLEGDSITGLGNPGVGQLAPYHRLANMLGCDDVWSSATGGTGFINSGGGSTLQTRSSSVIAAAPDIIYIRPINNDVGNSGAYTSATRIAAYTLYFDTLLASLPNLIIIAGGGYGTVAANLTTDAASAYQVEADMASAISTYNHPHVKFLPTISDAGGRWLYGDGHVGTTGNSTHGNSDLMIGDGIDQLHPNIRYYETIMWREYYGIINIMNSLI